jgi:hypothetical protein
VSACTGKRSLFGKPPAKEMISGSIATFSISRIKDLGTSVIRSAKTVFIHTSVILLVLSLKIYKQRQSQLFPGRFALPLHTPLLQYLPELMGVFFSNSLPSCFPFMPGPLNVMLIFAPFSRLQRQ